MRQCVSAGRDHGQSPFGVETGKLQGNVGAVTEAKENDFGDMKLVQKGSDSRAIS